MYSLTCINDRRGRDRRGDDEYAKHNKRFGIGSSDKNALPRDIACCDRLDRRCDCGGDRGGKETTAVVTRRST